MVEKKITKWQKIKTALCDLTKKLLPSNFVSRQSGLRFATNLQIHGWILLKKNLLYQLLLYFFTVNGLL